MMRELLTVNPRPKKSKRKAAKAATNPRKHKRRAHKAHRAKARRNPRILGLNVGSVTSQLTPALLGGVGALVTDIAIANIPFPAAIKAKIASGPLRLVARAALAIAAGYVAGMVTNKQNAAKVAAGGLAVVAYDGIKGLVRDQFPKLALGDPWQDGDLSGWNGLGAYSSNFPALERIDSLGAYDPPPFGPMAGLTAFEQPAIDPFDEF